MVLRRLSILRCSTRRMDNASSPLNWRKILARSIGSQVFRVVAGDFAYATTTPWASCCSTMHKYPIFCLKGCWSDSATFRSLAWSWNGISSGSLTRYPFRQALTRKKWITLWCKEPSDSPDERSTKRDFNLRVKSATCAKPRMSTVIIRSDVSNQDSVKEPAVVVMRRLKNGTNAHCPLQEYDLFDLSSWAW